MSIRLFMLLILVPVLAGCAGRPAHHRCEGEARTDWIRDNSMVLETTDPHAGLEDLEPLRRLVGDADIVALGEGTHGTREFFLLKHRIVRFLAEEMGFTLFAIEANMPECRRVGEVVNGGDGDPVKRLGGLLCWPWYTEEVLDLVLWMRDFNASGRGRMDFTGFDLQFPWLAMAQVVRFLECHDPDGALVVKEAYEAAKRAARGGADPAFATRRGAEVLALLEERAGAYRGRVPPGEVALALQNARLVHQCYRRKSGGGHRDLSMAENVRWLLEQAAPGARIVIWAHNGHVNREEWAMGGALSDWYGRRMVVIGFCCAEGEYSAAVERTIGVHPLAAPPPGSVEAQLSDTGHPLLLLDLRQASADSPASAWLTRRPFMRSIGAVVQDEQFFRMPLAGSYDLLVFVERTTPTHVLPQ